MTELEKATNGKVFKTVARTENFNPFKYTLNRMLAELEKAKVEKREPDLLSVFKDVTDTDKADFM